jgi:hypothetical protein
MLSGDDQLWPKYVYAILNIVILNLLFFKGLTTHSYFDMAAECPE